MFQPPSAPLTLARTGGVLLVAVLTALAALTVAPPALAATARVAVATNFVDAMTALRAAFAAGSEHQLVTINGSTGKLYAQIRAGAPFDVFLAADQLRPQLLEAGGQALAGSRITYAVGQLSLWSADPQAIGSDGPAALRALHTGKLAIANPDLAPYGLAARQTLQALGLYDQLAPQLVLGENIGQAWAMTATGNAHLGLVARAQTLRNDGPPGSHWDVPAGLHAPIRQDAVLLQRGANNPAAQLFLHWLAQPAARDIIGRFGYASDE